jgi:hypothetical protein
MKKFLFFFIAVFLYSANLINVNFFTSKNKIDVLLSLDDKFKGKVIKLKENSYEITNISADNIIQKEFNSFVSSIIIAPLDNNSIKIDIVSNNKVKVDVALTPDGYGVRFRLINADTTSVTSVQSVPLPQKNSVNLDMLSYVVALVVLFIVALLLLLFRKKNVFTSSDMKVVMQRPIDAKNKLVLLEFNSKKYLVIIGNTNILIDIFDKDFKTPKNEVEFDEMLKLSQKYDNIEEYIKRAEKLQNKDLDERV